MVSADGQLITDVSLVTKKPRRTIQMVEAPSKTQKDPLIASVLDDREVLGRIGKAKIQLIIKIQALIKGAAVRRRIGLLNLAERL
jgi:hypothetical protein